MASRNTSSASSELPRPSLLVPKKEAQLKLEKRIALGTELLQSPISNEDQLKAERAKRNKWHDFNQELLGSIFSNEKFAKEYRQKSNQSVGFISMGYTPLSEDIKDYHESVTRKINALESIIERLELFEDNQLPNASPSASASRSNNDDTVFVIHGHDEVIRSQVTSYLKDLGITPIVLNDQPNKGKTIIEKLEFYANKASFAIALLTPDDEGKSKTGDKSNSRARQNVILELGFFIGKLGRDNTCALYKQDVELPDFELPSDYSGVVYTPLDSSGGWKLLLAKELKAAGFKIDINKLI